MPSDLADRHGAALGQRHHGAIGVMRALHRDEKRVSTGSGGAALGEAKAGAESMTSACIYVLAYRTQVGQCGTLELLKQDLIGW
jgi:hypothetical protein